LVVVVVLSDPFQKMKDWECRDPTIGPRPKSRPEVINERSSAKDGMPERLRCGTIQKEGS